MSKIAEFPFFRVQFTKEGQVFQGAETQRLLDYLRATAGHPPVTDLLVISHGWNNDMAEAQKLYECLLQRLRQHRPAGRSFAVLGVFWPSKKFAEQELIPSGAASGGSLVTDEVLRAELDRLRGVFDAAAADQRLARAQELVPYLEDKKSARKEFAALLRDLVDDAAPAPDIDGAELVAETPDDMLVELLAQPDSALPPAQFDGEAGAGQVAGLSDWWGDMKSGALNLLNFTTYYQMKERAGKVGSQGLRAVLKAAVQARPGLRLHLIGHSFGGRLVTAAASGQADFKVSTLTLLQAAFSHYGFAQDYDGAGNHGFFRSLFKAAAPTVTGPVLITHSVRDIAVGRMYPLASRVARQVAAGLGDATDKYGGIGRNGALKTPEAATGKLLPVASAYAFKPGRILNLNADDVIRGHSDICRDEVAYAIMQAVATT
ncbi:alpha/beta hydrolase [Hymenobacter coalescens]